MPKVTVGTEPTLVYKSKHGTHGRPSRVEFRIDPSADSDSVIYYNRSNSVTVGGTDDDTDGFPILFSEVESDEWMCSGDMIWAVAASPVGVYYVVKGAL